MDLQLGNLPQVYLLALFRVLAILLPIMIYGRAMVSAKVGRLELTRGGETTTIRDNVIETIRPGERVTNMNPGGGGYGNPFERPVEKVVEDVRNGLVSAEGARADYGVAIDAETLAVDVEETARLRAA